MSGDRPQDPDEEADRFLKSVVEATDGRIKLPPPPLPLRSLPSVPDVPPDAPGGRMYPETGQSLSPLTPAAATVLPLAASRTRDDNPPAVRRRAPLTWLLSLSALALSGLVVWWTELMVEVPRPAGARPAAASTTQIAEPAPPQHRDVAPPQTDGAEPTRRIAQATRLPEVKAAADDPPRSPPPSIRIAPEIAVDAASEAPFTMLVASASIAASGSRLVVRGLPAGVRFSRGSPDPSGAWILAVGDIQDLEIAVPGQAAGQHRLDIELRSRDDDLLAAARTSLAIRPAAVAQSMSDAARVGEAATRAWLEEGRRLIGMGRITAARLVLERAADNGLGEAALVLGDTYDPAKLYALGVVGMTGDIKQAIRWYERADELGEPLAKARLSAIAPP